MGFAGFDLHRLNGIIFGGAISPTLLPRTNYARKGNDKELYWLICDRLIKIRG